MCGCKHANADDPLVDWMMGIALPMVLVAQALRSLAMVHASHSFSHEVSRGKKADDHVLVTWGVYRLVFCFSNFTTLSNKMAKTTTDL